MAAQPVIGLVGCGRWGKFILRDLLQLGCRVAVVGRSEQSRSAALAGGAFSVADRIAALPAVDGLVVATPTVTHAAVLAECVATGLPVYVEKPLTSDPDSAVRLAAAAGDRLFVMEKWRYHPAIEALADIARSGELGEVLGLRVERIQWGCNHTDADGSWILLPHDISIVREILGQVPPLTSVVGARDDGWALEVFATFGGKPWAQIESCVRFPGERREVQLYCARGTALMANPYESHVAVYRHAGYVSRKPPEPELRPISTEFPLLRELRAFLDFIGGGPRPKGLAREAAEHVAVVAAIREQLGMRGGLTAELDPPSGVAK